MMRGLVVAGPRPSQGVAAQIKKADIEDVSRLGAELLARLASGLGQRRLTHRNPDLRVSRSISGEHRFRPFAGLKSSGKVRPLAVIQWLRAGDGLGDRRDNRGTAAGLRRAACTRCGRVVVSLTAIFSIQGGLPQRWPRPAVSPRYSPPMWQATRG